MARTVRQPCWLHRLSMCFSVMNLPPRLQFTLILPSSGDIGVHFSTEWTPESNCNSVFVSDVLHGLFLAM